MRSGEDPLLSKIEYNRRMKYDRPYFRIHTMIRIEELIKRRYSEPSLKLYNTHVRRMQNDFERGYFRSTLDWWYGLD